MYPLVMWLMCILSCIDDHSRVRLRVQSDDETDYINGNYIDVSTRMLVYAIIHMSYIGTDTV